MQFAQATLMKGTFECARGESKPCYTLHWYPNPHAMSLCGQAGKKWGRRSCSTARLVILRAWPLWLRWCNKFMVCAQLSRVVLHRHDVPQSDRRQQHWACSRASAFPGSGRVVQSGSMDSVKVGPAGSIAASHGQLRTAYRRRAVTLAVAS